VLIRIWVPNFGSVVDLSAKFGADSATTSNVLEKSMELQFVDIIGFAFHVGSQCLNPANFSKSFALAKAEIAQAEKLGIKTQVLDIGGGLPVNYTLEMSFEEEIVKNLQNLLREIDDEIQVIAEPGRNIVATAATLVISIIGKTKRKNKTWYYIDDSIYNTFSGKIFDFTDYSIYPFYKDAVPGSEVVIAGNTCDGYDIISRSSVLPPDLNEGDILYVPNIGAYTLSSASGFNGFNPPKVYEIY